VRDALHHAEQLARIARPGVIDQSAERAGLDADGLPVEADAALAQGIEDEPAQILRAIHERR
jgi:hypothetical protein